MRPTLSFSSVQCPSAQWVEDFIFFKFLILGFCMHAQNADGILAKSPNIHEFFQSICFIFIENIKQEKKSENWLKIPADV